MPLPAIHIHLAPDNDHPLLTNTPSSDLTTTKDQPTATLFDLNSPTEQTHSFATLQEQDDHLEAFRPTHLLPPPSTSPRLQLNMQHRQTASPADKKGIDDSKFQELLKNSRERASILFANKKEPLELRKQVTLKAHKSGALERRALFLSKIEQRPSITAAQTPVTPPESPAIFHFSLPSPGLQSPLALFESLSLQEKKDHAKFDKGYPKRETWIEQVDFKNRVRNVHADHDVSTEAELDGDAGMIVENVANASLEGDLIIVRPETTRPLSRPTATLLNSTYDARRDFTRHPNINVPARRAPTIPSLDQISAHLASNRVAHGTALPGLITDNETDSDISSDDSHSNSISPVRTHRRTLTPPSINIVRAPSPPRAPRAPIPLPAFLNVRRRATEPTPASPKIAIPTVSVTPPTSDSMSSPVSSLASPLRSLSKRRSSNPGLPALSITLPYVANPTPAYNDTVLNSSPVQLSPHTALGPSAPTETRTQTGRAMVERLRRRSSPPALPQRRDVVNHPVLNLKGGF